MKLIEDMEKDVKGIKKNAMVLSWYSRGSMSYEDVLNMSNEERQLINEMAEEHFETTKKTQLPYF